MEKRKTYNPSSIVDFIAKSDDTEVWRMILVEEGPWNDDEIIDEMTRIQNRLYDCVDAAIDGQLAKIFPDTLAKIIQIQLDGYNLPKQEFEEFFGRFSENVFKIGDYASALENSEFISGVSFTLNLQNI